MLPGPAATNEVGVEGGQARDPQLLLAMEKQLGGDLDAAARIYAKLLAERPEWPEVQHLLGTVYCQLGDAGRAIECLRKAVSPAAPATWWCDYAVAMLSAGDEKGGEAALRRALVLAPKDEQSALLLGSLLLRQNRKEEALSCYRDAVARSPDSARLRDALGQALLRSGEPQRAGAEFANAVRLDPENPGFLAHLGAAQSQTGQFREAIDSLSGAMALDPANGPAAANLAVAWARLGEIEQTWRWARQAVALRPRDLAVRAQMLRTMHFVPGLTPEEIAGAHRACGALVETPETPAWPSGPRRTLRVGYVSALFDDHVVLVRAMLERVLGQTHETFCYADRFRRRRASAAALPSLVAEWRDITGLENAEVGQLVRHDGIDVLVNCDGYFVVNRLPVFRAAPARTQAALTIYPGTCGLDSIRYRFTDAVLEPKEEFQKYSSEELLALPSFACFNPPPAPDVADLPSLRTGCITYGSFSRFIKLNERVIAVWSRILNQAPGSRLLLHTYLPKEPGAADGRPADAVTAPLLTMFSARGIRPERIRFVGHLPLDAHLELYNRVDIALDPFPYNGMLTTLHALWMGVPVVALAGSTLAGRVGLSYLTNAGLPDWVAANEDRYVETAVRAANEPQRLAGLRASLRERVRRSVLTDGGRYGAALARAYRDLM